MGCLKGLPTLAENTKMAASGCLGLLLMQRLDQGKRRNENEGHAAEAVSVRRLLPASCDHSRIITKASE